MRASQAARKPTSNPGGLFVAGRALAVRAALITQIVTQSMGELGVLIGAMRDS